MKQPLSCVIIDDESIVENYIDDYLYKRLARDGCDKMSDFISDGLHLGFYSGTRLVGVVSFGLDGEDAVIHPKFRVRHMIYAKRCCMTSLDYLKRIGFKRVYALIPVIFKSNQRMAVECGLEESGVKQKPIYINNKPIEVSVYSILFTGAD